MILKVEMVAPLVEVLASILPSGSSYPRHRDVRRERETFKIERGRTLREVARDLHYRPGSQLSVTLT